MNSKLKFGLGNSKLEGNVLTFDLPAGHCCPFAKDCLACVDRETRKLTDGPDTVFRCFGASTEVRLPAVLEKHWYNYDLLKKTGLRSWKKMADLIDASLPAEDKYIKIRIHSTGGDFFNVSYFRAWCDVARRHPSKIFYVYSKAAPIVTRDELKPDNLRITGSLGGTHDEIFEQLGYPTARVVYSVEEAEELGLEIDHDDSHAVAADHDFALLIHNTQPKGSKAGKAMYKLRKAGLNGYGKSQKKARVSA